MEYLVVLPSTHLTLRAEKILAAARIGHRTVMKPRDISSDCGLAIRFAAGDLDRVGETVQSADLLPARFFVPEGGKWKLVRELSAGADGGRDIR